MEDEPLSERLSRNNDVPQKKRKKMIKCATRHKSQLLIYVK